MNRRRFLATTALSGAGLVALSGAANAFTMRQCGKDASAVACDEVQRHKQMLVESSADDVLLTTAFTGLQTSMLKPSIVAAGLDPNDLPARGAIDIGKDIDVTARENRPKRWRDIWSGGHSTSGVTDVMAVADLVARTAAEYRDAGRR